MSDQEEAEPTKPTATPHVPIVCVRYRYRLLGGHAHVRVFAGKDFDHLAKCGSLVFRLEEWAALVAVMDCDRNGVYDIVEEDEAKSALDSTCAVPSVCWSGWAIFTEDGDPDYYAYATDEETALTIARDAGCEGDIYAVEDGDGAGTCQEVA